MAYIVGGQRGRVEAQTQAADDLRLIVSKSLGAMTADQQAGYLAALIDGLAGLVDAASARKGASITPVMITKAARSGQRRNRVAKKARKKNRMRCPSCRGAMKATHRLCPSCGKPNLMGSRASKAARGVLTKAASPWNGGGSWCVRGHWTAAPRGRCCATCGDLMETSLVPPLAAVKSSAFADNYWRRELGSSHDPAQRMLYDQARWGAGQNGSTS